MPHLTLRPVTVAITLLLAGCQPFNQPMDSETSSSSEPATTSTSTTFDPTTTGFELVCMPGEARCADDKTVETCKKTGLSYEQSTCGKHQACQSGECIGPCEKAAEKSSSVGCEFIAIRMRSFSTDVGGDAMIVGNTDTAVTAEVQLYFTPNSTNKEEPLGDLVQLPPGASHVFQLDNDPMMGFSNIRTGGVYRVQSDIPITAYLHSTLNNKASNDSSMLLPTHTLRNNYIIASYPGFVDKDTPEDTNGRPSYFNVVALENETVVEWTPKFDTSGTDIPIPPILAGETGKITLNRFDVLQVAASSLHNTNYFTHDVSGTLVNADKPIWVMGATNCAFVPFNTGYCNHLQEQMLPVEYWGKIYVGAHSPLRGQEDHHWRIFAGADNVTVTFDGDPPLPQPFLLAKRGDFKDLVVPNGISFVFQGTGPILPVQYLAGSQAANKIGDPSMYQMIPVEQWLPRYVVVTGINYALNYAQVIRRFGAADVTINGELVTDYYLLNTVSGGKYQVADVLLVDGSEGRTYLVESADEFSVVIVGYTSGKDISAYAYPGGMNLIELNPG